MSQAYILKNIYLETAFEFDDAGNVVATKTELAHLQIEDGKITAIYWGDLPEHTHTFIQKDAGFALALPGINDAHIHLDKTYYGGPWKAAEQNKTVADMIQIEKKLLPEQLSVMPKRAKAILDLIISKGATKTLAHCNIDHSIGVQHFSHLQEIIAQYSNKIAIQTAAFPQHGLYKDNSLGLMHEVMAMGCNYVGGLDPALIDGNMQKSVDTSVQLALDYGAGLDIHLHERNETGKETLKYLFKQIEENPVLKSKVNLSHGFVLYDIFNDGELEDYAAKMKQLGVKLVTGVPIQFKMPLAELRDLGVTVEVGTDSVMDHWYPFGQGDIIERSNVIAQLYGWKNEYNLSRALYFATGTTPLNNAGELQWPQVGMAADMTLFKASCSAEIIARVSPRVASIFQGEFNPIA